MAEEGAQVLRIVILLCVPGVTALAKQRIGFVKEEHPLLAFCLREGPREVLLGLADVWTYDLGEIDALHRSVQLRGQRVGD